MTDRIPLDNLTSDQYDALCDQLEALRAVARGYCPDCGRGDAAPTVTGWETERRRADQAEDLLRVAHETSSKSETERARAVQRAEHAEAALDRVRAALHPYAGPILGDRSRGVQMGWDRARQAVLAALDEPAPGTDGLHARHVNVDLHNVCEYSVNRAALCLVDFIRAEFPGVHVTTDAREWDERAPDPGAGAATQATAPAAWGPSAGRPGS